MTNLSCQQARTYITNARGGRPESLSHAEAHIASCPECSDYRAALVGIEHLGQVHYKTMPEPSEAVRQRLHRQWRQRLVCETPADRFRAWLRSYLIPDVLEPLAPHAALMIMVIGISLGVTTIQERWGLIELLPDALEQRLVASADPLLTGECEDAVMLVEASGAHEVWRA